MKYDEKYYLAKFINEFQQYDGTFQEFITKDKKHVTLYFNGDGKTNKANHYWETHIAFFENHFCVGAELDCEKGWSDCIAYSNPKDFKETLQRAINYVGIEKRKPQYEQLTLF